MTTRTEWVMDVGSCSGLGLQVNEMYFEDILKY